ncbi:hypothetical protein CB1_000526016 [Camelus ferus]|nr:hypothetical protein CB1_000526016 [Camelus ferus]
MQSDWPEKFQQKALKQTKQKKSKSAEFLMVREDREASEGTGNPAFNTSSPDLSAYQTSEKKVIRRDTLARTLAAHQQKFRLRASAEPKGVTSVLIIFTFGDSCCAPELTWASRSRHLAFHSGVSAQASCEALHATRQDTLRTCFAVGTQGILS